MNIHCKSSEPLPVAAENAMSHPFLPLSSPPTSPDSPRLRPRRPSLEPEREILSTRGQRFLNFLPSRSSSAALQELNQDPSPKFLRRGSQLIGHSNPRYEWQRYYRAPDTLKTLPASIRKYYERNNAIIAQYLYIDRLLDSSLPHNLIDDYDGCGHSHAPNDIDSLDRGINQEVSLNSNSSKAARIKRTPHNLYRIPDETAPLLNPSPDDEESTHHSMPDCEPSHGKMSPEKEEHLINLAIRINFVANVLLLASKVAIIVLTSSMSMLAGLVDGVLDFLSTVIIWITTIMIRRQDRNRFPISRRRLEPLSVLIFSVIMVTSFFQVGLTSINRLTSGDHTLVELSIPSITLMAGTVIVKLMCWLWCRLIPSPGVQVLAQDAMTDVVFNTFSIIFPLIGSFARLWYLDPLGGLVLSIYIMWNWGSTANEYIRRLTGAAASADDHNILLYMTMRFSRVIQKIQDLKAYYAGDKLNVEVDLVVDEKTSLRDAHDVGESLQYILESVPTVDRAFVHLDYDPWNLPSHMNQLDR